MAAKENKMVAPPGDAGAPDKGLPGGGKGRVDVTGVLPEGIAIDPNLTEGNPGYGESGDSEMHPTEPGTQKGKSTPN